MNVRFHPLGLAAVAKENETLLDGARRAGAPLANACGGIGICARCRVQVIEGALREPTAIERRIADQRGFEAGERLACQAVVLGDCVVTTTYWG